VTVRVGAYERLAATTVVIALGLALSLITTQAILWITVCFVGGIACIGADHAIHARWQRQRRGTYDALLWVFPTTVVAGSFAVIRLPFFDSPSTAIPAVLGCALMYAGIVICQMHSLTPGQRGFRTARFILSLLAHIGACAIYAGIYAPRYRSLVSATAIAIVTVLFAIEILRGGQLGALRTLAYSLLLGAIVGEVTWVLNYWPIAPQFGGVLLMVTLYVAAGVLQTQSTKQRSRSDILEFIVVGLSAIGIVLGFGVAAS